MKTTINNLLTATTDEVLEHCAKELLKYYPRKEGKSQVFAHKDDFIYATGDNPICLVSHVDTVRDRQTTGKSFRASVGGEKPVMLVHTRNVLTNANGILGADDRAGVFACLDLVRKCHRDGLPMPSVILCNGEESGGLGVGVFVTTEAFKRHDRGTRLFVEMDRCNATEWVTYGSALPNEVCNYVESFGFKKGHGSYSDIADLQEAYLIPAVNLSIGYYGQHTHAECLHIDEMYMTINRVHQMLRDPIRQLHPVNKKWVYTPPAQSNYRSSDYERTHGGNSSKNVGGGRGNVSVSSSIPPEKTGKSYVDEVLDHITFGGYCPKCGFNWADCTCGEMLKQLLTFFEDADLKFIADNYLTEVDPMYEMMDEYLKAVADLPGGAAKKEDEEDKTKDPFHVGKEGEPVDTLLLPGPLSEVKDPA